MTIIEVAQELEKDGTKRFTRPSWRGWGMGQINGDLFVISPGETMVGKVRLNINDLLTTDWEEVL